MSVHNELSREDYEEPRCLLDMNKGLQSAPLRSIPMARVTEKLDEYLSRDDWAGAERHLNYWLADAENAGDRMAQLAIESERMGLFRKRGRRDDAFAAAESALRLLADPDIADSLTAATAYVNIATVYKTFSMPEKALSWFMKARPVYEKYLKDGDVRLGGLYNNLALALADLERFDEARGYYRRALTVMKQAAGGELEQAVTWLNLADLETAEKGYEEAEDRVQTCLDRARLLLDTPSLPRNGYYAYVLRCCVPTFEYYGRFMDAQELEEVSSAIYRQQKEKA